MSINATPDDATIAQKSAQMFLQIGAVNFNAKQPYTFASGLKSPVYIDCRKLISYPRVRSELMDFAVCKLYRTLGQDCFDSIAGGETAGIPFAAWIADKMDLPMQYVRKKPKGYGRNAQIEGEMHDKQRVLLVEDLATDGGSKLRFAQAIEKTGARCAHILVVFYYDIFKTTRGMLESHNLRLTYLLTWWDILAQARADNHFDAQTLEQVEAFLHAPLAWSNAHGGVDVNPSAQAQSKA